MLFVWTEEHVSEEGGIEARTLGWDRNTGGSQYQSEEFGQCSIGNWKSFSSFQLETDLSLLCFSWQPRAEQIEDRETGDREANQGMTSRAQPKSNDYSIIYSCISIFQRWLHAFSISFSSLFLLIFTCLVLIFICKKRGVTL